MKNIKIDFSSKTLKVVIAIVVAIVALITIIAIVKSNSKEVVDTSVGIAKLEALDTADVANAEAAILEAQKASLLYDDELSSEEESTDGEDGEGADGEETTTRKKTVAETIFGTKLTADMDLTQGQMANVKEALGGTIICGDSIVEAVNDYDIIPESFLIYKRGACISNSKDDIEKAVALADKNLVLVYGLNDIEEFKGDPEPFIEDYTSVIKEIQKDKPGLNIYVAGMLGYTEKGLETVPAYEYMDDYNKAFEKMCQETGATYINGIDYVDSYEPDGCHPSARSSKVWVAHVAEVVNGG